MKRSVQAAQLAAVALVAAVAGILASRYAGQARVDTGALLAASLPDQEGQRHRLEQWRGRVLVVNFWATWCPPCVEEIPELARMQARLGASGLQVVGIAVDSEANVREFAQKQQINYPLLIGNAGAIELSRLAGNKRGGLPYTLVLDRDGRAIRTFSGAATEAGLTPVVLPALRR